MGSLAIPKARRSSARTATLRRWIIEQAFASRTGHIGSALSVVEIIAALWGKVLRDAGTRDPNRDRFILAKGHAALALYSAMRWQGLLTEADFATYCHDGSRLGVHPEHSLPGIDLSTGSLGQGLSVACGLAYGLRLKRSPARVFVLMSDAECNEGQVWEAAMFAGHHRLANLIAIVDWNGTQAMGPTEQILDLAPLAKKWTAFGWDALEVDGHDVDELVNALQPAPNRPRLVVSHTAMGKGVSFMEGSTAWHYLGLNPNQREQALAELEAAA